MKKSAPLKSFVFVQLFLLFLQFVSSARTIGADTFSLFLPVKCEPGLTCFFQNYVDHDTSNGARDYLCGNRTYDGHTGTDIRIADGEVQRRGVEVLAAAPGRVIATRDGVEDVSVRISGKAAILGKECGNGAVVEHKEQWQTQYCHLAKGSLRVHPGDSVSVGQALGLIGLSGDTEFFHLHFAVKHRGEIVDPFAYGETSGSCGSGRSIWAYSLREKLKYRSREILNFGFSSIPPTMELIEEGEITKHSVTASSNSLVAYVRAIGLQEGDVQMLTLQNPSGTVMSQYSPQAVDHDKAQSFIAAGRKREGVEWLFGTYTATYRVLREGVEVLRKTFDLEMNSK